MSQREGFEHIYSGGDGLALAILYGLRQIKLVEKDVPKLLRRADVELASSAIVNFFRLDADFTFKARRHVGKSFPVDLHSRVFHAKQHRNKREVDFPVKLEQVVLFDFLAKRGGEPSGDVSGLGKAPT